MSFKPRILIFIQSSLGELDWVAPFILSDEARCFEFDVFFNRVGVNDDQRLEILKQYGLIDKVRLIKSHPKWLKRSKFFFDLGKKILPIANRWAQRSVANAFEDVSGYAAIFRDYGLKPSAPLEYLLTVNPSAKVVVYPHAVGLQRLSPNAAQKFKRVREVSVDLWLENSDLSNRVLNQYGDQFFVSGAPGLVVENSFFDENSSDVLILTRNTYEPYGCSRSEALGRYREVLEVCNNQGLKVWVKHHPRDRKLKDYEKIEAQFNQVQNYSGSLIKFQKPLKCVLTFFSTAGLFLTAAKIPVIDITPYSDPEQKEVKNLPLHYVLDGLLTHDLIRYGFQYRLDSTNELIELLKKDSLIALSEQQFLALQNHFPSDANARIAEKLKEILL